MSWAATAASIISTIVSAGITAYGNEKATDAANDAAVANKITADAEARNRELEAAEAIKRQRLRDKREKSAIRARLAQSGSLTTSGTPLLILGDTAASQELAIQDAVRSTSAEAASLRAQGQMGLWEAKAAGVAGDIKTAGAIVGAVSDGFGLYTRTKRVS